MNGFEKLEEKIMMATVCIIVVCCCCLLVCFSSDNEIRFPTRDNTDDHLTGYDTDIVLTGSDALDPILE